MAQKTPAIFNETSTPDSPGIPSVYEIPEWLRNPTTNVLIYRQWTSNPKDFDANPQARVILLNPLTGEKFSLKLENEQPYEWIDNQKVGFSTFQDLECPSGMAYSYILNLTTGNLLINDARELFCAPDHSEGIFVNTWDGNVEYSSDGEYIEFMPSSADFDYGYAAVSSDGTTLGIIQRDLNTQEPKRIAIYDFSTRKELAILYVEDLNPIFHFIGNEHKIAYFEGNTPCLFSWDVLEKECGLPLPDEYHNIYFEYINDEAAIIGFIYPGIPTSNGGGWVLCLYDIFGGGISCPTKDLEIFTPLIGEIDGRAFITANSVIDTLFSPDGRFVYFVYGFGSPGGHFFPSPLNKAVMNIDGEKFLDLGLVSEDGFYASSAGTGQWRPLP